MERIVTLAVNCSEYNISRAAKRSMTVRELINELENYHDDEKVVFSNDNGYTYGFISPSFIERQTVEDEEE